MRPNLDLYRARYGAFLDRVAAATSRADVVGASDELLASKQLLGSSARITRAIKRTCPAS